MGGSWRAWDPSTLKATSPLFYPNTARLYFIFLVYVPSDTVDRRHEALRRPLSALRRLNRVMQNWPPPSLGYVATYYLKPLVYYPFTLLACRESAL